jgi:hypothetical protein
MSIRPGGAEESSEDYAGTCPASDLRRPSGARRNRINLLRVPLRSTRSYSRRPLRGRSPAFAAIDLDDRRLLPPASSTGLEPTTTGQWAEKTAQCTVGDEIGSGRDGFRLSQLQKSLPRRMMMNIVMKIDPEPP